MPDSRFVHALRDRVLLPTVDGTIPACQNQGLPNSHGNPRTNGAARRHNMVTDQIAACLAALQLPNALEPVLERRNALNGGKRGDLVCRGLHSNGDGVVFDVSIVDPTSNEVACKAADETGAAALHVRQEKAKNITWCARSAASPSNHSSSRPLASSTRASSISSPLPRPAPQTSPIRSPSL